MEQHIGKGTDRLASEEALTVSPLIARSACPTSHVTSVKSSNDNDDDDDDDDDDDSGGGGGGGDHEDDIDDIDDIDDDDDTDNSNVHVHDRLERHFSGSMIVNAETALRVNVDARGDAKRMQDPAGIRKPQDKQ
ncbi:hypothetical protein HN011_007683, partial [Eciton burchellii]